MGHSERTAGKQHTHLASLCSMLIQSVLFPSGREPGKHGGGKNGRNRRRRPTSFLSFQVSNASLYPVLSAEHLMAPNLFQIILSIISLLVPNILELFCCCLCWIIRQLPVKYACHGTEFIVINVIINHDVLKLPNFVDWKMSRRKCQETAIPVMTSWGWLKKKKKVHLKIVLLLDLTSPGGVGLVQLHCTASCDN